MWISLHLPRGTRQLMRIVTTILAQLQHWLHPNSNALWVELEQAQIPRGNLHDCLIPAPLNTSLDGNLAPPILASPHSWVHLCKYQQWSSNVTPLKLPISALSQLIPDINLNIWKETGITHLEYILEDPSLKSFRTFHLESNLPFKEKYTVGTERIQTPLKFSLCYIAAIC